MRIFPRAWLCGVFLLCCTCAYSQNHQVAVGDLNGDGKPDLVVANPSLQNIGVFLNTGGALGPGSFFAVSSRPDAVSLADVNGDGHPDIIALVTDSSANSHLLVLLGNGQGGFAAPAEIPRGSTGTISDFVIADFNGDGFRDIAFAPVASPPQINILFGDGHGGFSAPRVIPVANDTTSADRLLLLDANKDSKTDLVLNTGRVIPEFLHESFLLLNDGTANFSISELISSSFLSDTAGWVSAVADFNGDGFPDLRFGVGSASFITFGDGHGGALYVSPTIPFIRSPDGFAADVDGNQTIDLVSPGLGSYFPGNGHGGFGDPISLGFPQGSTLIAVADMNGDGKPDFILQSGTNVSVVLNSLATPASFSASTQFTMSASAGTTSVGLPVTLSASVFSYGGAPAGSVTFFDGAQTLGSAAVNPYGAAAITSSFSAGGLHNLTASFSGMLDPATNTLFLNSNGPGFSSISVNTSQPTASAPAITLTAFPNPARVRNPVAFSATVTSSSGTPTGSVVFTADGNVLGISPLGPSTASILVSFPAVGLHNLQATYGGDASFPQATSAALVEDVRLTIPADFTINTSPQSATIKAGQTATFNITINPTGDMTSTVGFSCSGLPAASTCSFSPPILTPGINPVSTTLTVTTTAAAAAVPLNNRQPGPLLWLLALAGFFALLVSTALHGNRIRKLAPLLAAIAFVVLLGSCGGGGSSGTPGPPNGTPPGTSSITVTAISATSHTAALSITVTP